MVTTSPATEKQIGQVSVLKPSPPYTTELGSRTKIQNSCGAVLLPPWSAWLVDAAAALYIAFVAHKVVKASCAVAAVTASLVTDFASP
jgi:hypothetical protein